MLKKVVPIILLIVWLIVIFSFSSQEGSVSQSKSRIITDYIHENYDGIVNDIDRDILHYLVRKTAHITLYFILCLLTILVLYCIGLKGKDIYIKSFIICIFFAAIDEIQQRFISDRSGKLTDVFIDGIGIVLGITLAIVIEKAYNYIKRRS